MSEVKTTTDFTLLHQAMIDDIKGKLPSIKTVVAYDPTDENSGGQHQSVKTPAVLIELSEMKPGTSRGDGRQAFECEFILHCILSVKTANVQLEIRNYVAAVAKEVWRNKWGLSGCVELPEDISAYPGVFKAGDKGFESWVVSYSQKIYLGDLPLTTETVPTDVFIGFSPKVGPDNQADYVEVTA